MRVRKVAILGSSGLVAQRFQQRLAGLLLPRHELVQGQRPRAAQVLFGVGAVDERHLGVLVGRILQCAVARCWKHEGYIEF